MAKYRDAAGCATLLALLNAGHNSLDDLIDGPKVTFRYLRGWRSVRVILGGVAHERGQPDRALSFPFREPVFGYSLGYFLVGYGGPERGPGARHDAPDVVATAAGGDPTAFAELVGEVVHPMWHMFVEAGRCREVCEGVERYVDGESDAIVTALLPHLTRPWEQVASRLVHRDGQDVGVAVEHPLHAVAVVGVGVDVGDADAGMFLSQA